MLFQKANREHHSIKRSQKQIRMEAFFRTHTYLVEHTTAPVRRGLMDEIDWNDRLIGIKGTRGVGKTTFLLQYAKENFDTRDKQCLYVNMNHFYFQEKGIEEFAGEFYRQGGKVLLVDQVFKQQNWSKGLRKCYDSYPDLKIIFTISVPIHLMRYSPTMSTSSSRYCPRHVHRSISRTMSITGSIPSSRSAATIRRIS